MTAHEHKNTTAHIKEHAASATDPKALSAAAETVPPKDHAAPKGINPNSLESRVALLEQAVWHWHSIYQWPLPDGMVPEPNKPADA